MINAQELKVGNNVYYTVLGSEKHLGEITQVVKTETGIKATIDYHYPLLQLLYVACLCGMYLK